MFSGADNIQAHIHLSYRNIILALVYHAQWYRVALEKSRISKQENVFLCVPLFLFFAFSGRTDMERVFNKGCNCTPMARMARMGSPFPFSASLLL
jgi:hypothetical protein